MITRKQVADEAMKLLGVPFLHQGRDASIGVDCVGVPVVVARNLGYENIVDVEGYRRVPSAEVIRETLRANCDEITVSEVGVGDIFLMRIGGRKPRHAAIVVSNETDIARGIEPMLLHAKGMGAKGKVVLEPVRQWIMHCVCGFRLRGLVD